MKWTWICHVDKKIFFSNLTIIINQVWLHQKVQTTKEMRNLANYKFTVWWACMAVIKSVCKIVWRAASVLFVFQWYYNRRPPGAQPTFSLNPSLKMARVYFVGSWFRIGIHIPPKKLCPSCDADWKCAWCALQLRFLSNLFISQFDLCIELKVYTFCPSFELFSSCQCPASDLWVIYTGVVWELARAAPSGPDWQPISSNIYQHFPLLLPYLIPPLFSARC